MRNFFLTEKDCAGCRQCCSFQSCDLLLTPLITPPVREKILASFRPGQRFIHHGSCYLLRLDREEDSDLYYCSLLDRSRGCIMGDDKPLECRIWPLRVMRRDGGLVITLSPLCPKAAGLDREPILAAAAAMAEEIFSEARTYPELVKPYEPGFEILVRESTVEGNE